MVNRFKFSNCSPLECQGLNAYIILIGKEHTLEHVANRLLTYLEISGDVKLKDLAEQGR